MKKISLIILFTSIALTGILLVLWALGFAFAGQAVGSLIHLLLVLALISSAGVVTGLVLFIVSLVRK